MVERVAGRTPEAVRLQRALDFLGLAVLAAEQLDRKGPFSVRGVEQRAVRPVVQIERVALLEFDLGEDRRAFGD